MRRRYLDNEEAVFAEGISRFYQLAAGIHKSPNPVRRVTFNTHTTKVSVVRPILNVLKLLHTSFMKKHSIAEFDL